MNKMYIKMSVICGMPLTVVSLGIKSPLCESPVTPLLPNGQWLFYVDVLVRTTHPDNVMSPMKPYNCQTWRHVDISVCVKQPTACQDRQGKLVYTRYRQSLNFKILNVFASFYLLTSSSWYPLLPIEVRVRRISITRVPTSVTYCNNVFSASVTIRR